MFIEHCGKILQSIVSHSGNWCSVVLVELKNMCILYLQYSNYRNYAPPLDVKGGIITEKVVPVFSESFFGACFGMVM